jgi:two-component system NarL family sensor kinase
VRIGGRSRASRPRPSRELAEFRARLSEAEETLHAIQGGGVDALVVAGKRGPRVYTLEGVEHAYRVLIESMNEGALTLTPKAVILYANHCFAKMVKCPLERIMGHSFQRFLSAEGRAAMRALLKRPVRSGSRLQVFLKAGDGSQMSAQISIRRLSRNASRSASFGIVVTDMTETRRSQEQLRVLTHRLVQAQESERGRVALDLTDNITQSLVVILFRLQTLVDKLPASEWPSRGEVVKLSELLGQTADEVERISRNLRPSVLRNLGLIAALRAANREFAKRTGMRIKLACVKLSRPLPAEAKLALYRIFEEALRNVEKHAGARHVTVSLTQWGAFAQFAIKDDGTGFDPDRLPAKRREEDGFGLLRMRERAEFLGGVLTIKSARRAGTEVKVTVPLSAGVPVTAMRLPTDKDLPVRIRSISS